MLMRMIFLMQIVNMLHERGRGKTCDEGSVLEAAAERIRNSGILILLVLDSVQHAGTMISFFLTPEPGILSGCWILVLSERACSPALAEAFSIAREAFCVPIRLPSYHDATVRDKRNTTIFLLLPTFFRLLQHGGARR